MANLLSDLVVKLGLDSSGFEAGVNKAGNATEGLSSQLGGMIGKWAGPAGIALLAKAAFDLGTAWEKASADIAKATGATGPALDAMNASLKRVMASGSEQGLEEVSKAMAALSKSFKLTGDALEETTAQFGKFGDVTETDMKQAVVETNGAMKAWGATIDELPDYLDALTVAQQKTNQSASQYNQTMNTAAPLMKSYGFSMKEGINLFAAMGAVEIDTGKAMFALNAAMKKFTDQGLEAGPALRDIFQRIADLGPGTQATSLAMEVFGAKAGIVLGEKIANGTLKLDDMVKSLGDVRGALEKTDKASGELGDDIAATMGKLGAHFSGTGTWLTGVLNDALKGLNNGITGIDAGFNQFTGMLSGDVGKETRAYTEKLKVMTMGTYDQKDAFASLSTEAREFLRVQENLNRTAMESEIWKSKVGMETGKGKTKTNLTDAEMDIALGIAPKKATGPAYETDAQKAAKKAWLDLYNAQMSYMEDLRAKAEMTAEDRIEYEEAAALKVIANTRWVGLTIEDMNKQHHEAIALVNDQFDAKRVELAKKTEEEITKARESQMSKQLAMVLKAADKERAATEKKYADFTTASTAAFSVLGALNTELGLGFNKTLGEMQGLVTGVTGLMKNGIYDVGSWAQVAVSMIGLVADGVRSLMGEETEVQKKEREGREKAAQAREAERLDINAKAAERMASKMQVLENELNNEILNANKVGADTLDIERYYARQKARARREINAEVVAAEKAIAVEEEKIAKDATAKKNALIAKNDADFKQEWKAFYEATLGHYTGWSTIQQLEAMKAKYAKALADSLKEIDDTTATAMEPLADTFLKFQDRAMEASGGIGQALISGIKAGNTREDFKKTVQDLLKGMAIDAALLAAGIGDKFNAIGGYIAEALKDGILSSSELSTIDEMVNKLYDETIALTQPIIDLLGGGAITNTGTSSTGISTGADVVTGLVGGGAGMGGAMGINGSLSAGATIVQNFYSPTVPTPLETTRMVAKTMQDLSFTGVI